MTVTKFKILLVITLSSLLVTGLGLVLSRYATEMRAADRALENLGSQVIDTPCGPLEYARVGQGQPVLAVHGTMGGFDQGLVAAKPAIDAGYQVISISRFGYLRTPLPADASVDNQAQAFACLLDALDITKVAIITTSGGAVSSIRFAIRYPERVSALVLISPSAPGSVKVAPPPRAVFDMLRSDFLWWMMITYMRPLAQTIIGVPRGLMLTPQDHAEVRQALATSLPISDRVDGSIFDNYNVDNDFYAEILPGSPNCVENIQAPVLVINALDDPYAVPENVRGLAEKFPHAQLRVLPDGGHELLGHSAELSAAIAQFLQGTIGSGPN
jgi:pimeloyl-ACP methyl ester carboxylesterase